MGMGIPEVRKPFRRDFQQEVRSELLGWGEVETETGSIEERLAEAEVLGWN